MSHPNPDQAADLEAQPGVSGHVDPAGQAPWAMPLVVRVEKSDIPTHTAVCEAAARAVVLLLTDERALPGGPWAAAIGRWNDGRIRKVVRRARGSRWEATATLANVTVEHDGAQVRAFVPGATDQVPAELAKLQVSGLDLADAEDLPPLPSPATTTDVVVVTLALTPHFSLTTGKAAAQAAHAAQLAALRMPAPLRATWVAGGAQVRLLHPEAEQWAHHCAVAPVKVTDAGFTEIPPGTDTALAWW